MRECSEVGVWLSGVGAGDVESGDGEGGLKIMLDSSSCIFSS